MVCWLCRQKSNRTKQVAFRNSQRWMRSSFWFTFWSNIELRAGAGVLLFLLAVRRDVAHKVPAVGSKQRNVLSSSCMLTVLPLQLSARRKWVMLPLMVSISLSAGFISFPPLSPRTKRCVFPPYGIDWRLVQAKQSEF